MVEPACVYCDLIYVMIKAPAPSHQKALGLIPTRQWVLGKTDMTFFFMGWPKITIFWGNVHTKL